MALRVSRLFSPVVGLAVACGGPVHVLPPELAAGTIVVGHQAQSEGPWRVEILAANEPWSVSFPEDQTVVVLGYDESPAMLGIREPAPVPCRVRRPKTVLVLGEGASGWDWFPISEAPASLLDTIAGDGARCDPCAPIELRSVLAPHSYRYIGLGHFEDGSVLGVFVIGLAHIMQDLIVEIPVCPGLFPIQTPDGPRFSGFAAGVELGANRFAVSSQHGDLAIIRFANPGGACEVETSTSAPPEDLPPRQLAFESIAVNPDARSDHDFYALRNNGDLYHWTAGGFTRLGTHRIHPNLQLAEPTALIRLDRSRLVSSAGWKHVKHWVDGVEVLEETLELANLGVSNTPRDRITALAVDHRGERFLAGTAPGEVWQRPLDGGLWSPVAKLPVTESVGSFIELETRFLLPLNGGDLVSWHRDGEMCERATRIPGASNGGHGRRVLKDGDRHLIGDSIGTASANAGVVWVGP